jgi:toxin ParE1/3/4
MPSFRFSARARTDLRDIAAYTLKQWGETQCGRYLSELEACCQWLAENPKLGSVYPNLPGYWRRPQGKHVVFYRPEATGILVVRVLHERMLPENHLGPDDDEDDF